MQKDSKIALAFCGTAIGLLFISVLVRGSTPQTPLQANSGISMENGIQIIDMTAKGGFSPSSITAKAGVPTELRVATNGTYDCSSTLVIPSLSYQKTLKPTGTETITISSEKATGTLNGTCGMGMYKFQIAFK